jgi:alpha-glucosidase
MTEAKIPPEEGMDPWGKNVDYLSRDGARTPMQWSSASNAGFTTGTPWLRLAANSDSINVETELEDPRSMLNLYRRLLAARRDSEALRIGSFLTHPASNNQILVYPRESNEEIATVALNLSDEEARVKIRSGMVIVSTADPDRAETISNKLLLEPYEGVLVTHQ